MTDARAIAVATLAKYGGRRWPDERGYPYTPAAEAICNLEAALRALLAAEPAKGADQTEQPCGCYAPDGDRCPRHPAPPARDEVREAAESDVRQLRRLQRAEALLLDVWDAWHREGHEQSETIDAAIDRLGDWRWNEGYDPCNPPLRPDPRKAIAALRGGAKGGE